VRMYAVRNEIMRRILKFLIVWSFKTLLFAALSAVLVDHTELLGDASSVDLPCLVLQDLPSIFGESLMKPLARGILQISTSDFCGSNGGPIWARRPLQ